MSWQKSVRELDFVQPFAGGTKSEREHLNEMVDAVNDIITAAQQQPEQDKGNVVLFYVNENGVAVKYNFLATKAQLV